MNYIIGFDAGTTAFKAGLYDERLQPVEVISKEYSLQYNKKGFVTLDPRVYWDSFCELTHRLFAQTGVAPDQVSGLSICSQGETLICLDERGDPLYDAIIWTDARAVSQARELSVQFPDRRVFEVTGQRGLAGVWPSAKILWIKENLPDVFRGTACFCLLEDYLIHRLTGCFATEKSISSSTTYLDIRKGVWWGEMLDAIGISQRKLPELFESGQRIANITPEAASRTGLSINTAVISGALDQAAGMLGAGNIRQGIITETTGTCLAVCANLGSRFASFEEGLLPIHYGIAPDSYYAIYWSPAAGSIYKWVRDTFYSDLERKDLYSLMDREAEQVPAGCDGLLLLPYLSGMNYPVNEERARGVFLGLSLQHTRAYFARAVLESVAFLLRQSIEEVTGYGMEVSGIYSLGGGAGDLWCQIKADVTGKSIRTIDVDEVACHGAAMLAAVGSGLFSSYEEAVSVVREKQVYHPVQPALYDGIYLNFLNKNKHYIAEFGNTF